MSQANFHTSVQKKKVQSRDQLRAKHALNAIETLKSEKADGKKIKSAVAGLPAMIHTNGLGHAFAFFLSDVKKFPERKKVVDVVFHWLDKESKVFTELNDSKLTPLNAITRVDMVTYQIAQQEAQAYLLWLKKFARALLTDEEDTFMQSKGV